MVLPRTLAKFNRSVTNRVAGLFAGRAPGFAILQHRGRKSGRLYRTPISIFHADGVYRIAMTYGREVDWAKNICAAGEFSVETRRHGDGQAAPGVSPDTPAPWAPTGFPPTARYQYCQI
ncbi:nitroreductase family deazaflavin-dependent oxidoreductase [Nocardia brasiliensis]|uniref:nitroreductase family deazaflavin-dependent oxidoreductase n=1 Tax=Nocardia brasiliensis TaxID=37326 RepID=UPI0024581856|nr:nitroreductase family deazaflavin-dependent oxidoreductase [Nocardia brasiliensis]